MCVKTELHTIHTYVHTIYNGIQVVSSATVVLNDRVLPVSAFADDSHLKVVHPTGSRNGVGGTHRGSVLVVLATPCHTHTHTHQTVTKKPTNIHFKRTNRQTGLCCLIHNNLGTSNHRYVHLRVRVHLCSVLGDCSAISQYTCTCL